jgi:hypothetical protein
MINDEEKFDDAFLPWIHKYNPQSLNSLTFHKDIKDSLIKLV